MMKVIGKYRYLLLIILCLFSYKWLGHWAANQMMIDLSEPVFESYRSDEMYFLKTFYLVEKDGKFYQNSYDAFAGKIGDVGLGNDVFTWRLPTVFYLWSVLANLGEDILGLFIVMGVVAILALFDMATKLSNRRIGYVSSLLLLPYFGSLVVYPSAFLFTEWWGMFFLVYGLWMLFKNQSGLGWSLMLLAIGIRSLMIIPVGFVALAWLGFHKKEWKYLILVTIGFLTLMTIHRVMIVGIVGESAGSLLDSGERLHLISSETVYPMLAFLMQLFPGAGVKSYLLVIGFALLGNILSFRRRKDIYSLLLGCAWIPSILIFPFIVTSKYTGYWSIMWYPFALASSALAIYEMGLILNKFRLKKDEK